MVIDINYLKKNQRDICAKKRLILKKKVNLENVFYYNILNKYKWFSNCKVVGSFISIKSEISTDSINLFILSNKKILCLPVIQKINRPLIFKKYLKGDTLTTGMFNVSEPVRSKLFLPEIIFIPCLAFDINGYRLGYGGGYYDRTISYLNSIQHSCCYRVPGGNCAET